jgi:mannose-6-phosphate isomerase-like protein (cupin superfamily)
MQTVFQTIKQQLQSQGFTVDYQNLQRPWGGFYALQESQAVMFIKLHFPEHQKLLADGLPLKPKVLMVAPGKRLSWQYHHRRSELWRVVEGPVGVVMSETDEENEPKHYQTGELITLPKGVRHRLIGLENTGIIAEIWQHTDPQNPSNEDDIVRLQDDFGRES